MHVRDRREPLAAELLQEHRPVHAGLPLDQVCGLRKIGDGEIEFSHRDVAVAAMAQEARILGEALHATREDVDRLAIAAEVGGAPTEPDEGVGGGGVGPVC